MCHDNELTNFDCPLVPSLLVVKLVNCCLIICRTLIPVHGLLAHTIHVHARTFPKLAAFTGCD